MQTPTLGVQKVAANPKMSQVPRSNGARASELVGSLVSDLEMQVFSLNARVAELEAELAVQQSQQELLPPSFTNDRFDRMPPEVKAEVLKYQRARDDCHNMEANFRAQLAEVRTMQRDLDNMALRTERDSLLRELANDEQQCGRSAAVEAELERMRMTAFFHEREHLRLKEAWDRDFDFHRLNNDLRRFIVEYGPQLGSAITELVSMRRMAGLRAGPLEQLSFDITLLRNSVLHARHLFASSAARAKTASTGKYSTHEQFNALSAPSRRPASAAGRPMPPPHMVPMAHLQDTILASRSRPPIPVHSNGRLGRANSAGNARAPGHRRPPQNVRTNACAAATTIAWTPSRRRDVDGLPARNELQGSDALKYYHGLKG